MTESIDTQYKILDWDAAAKFVAKCHLAEKRVAFTNGCFDLLHPGHVRILQESRKTADALVLGLNTDASVQRLKGPTRPVQCEADRAMVLAALACIDCVVLFDEDTPLELLCHLQPDVLVKGADYTKAEVVGATEIESWGGEVRLVDLVEGRSTTSLIEKSKQ
ncbi:MAG: D-glycero-beta-D-manno-heptose 1-phosphate adenylyltransferase [Phycisphaerales bacterium]|jgi:D-beta-D-heptose 7-phosphate kinase / D-beta-D-heptose 1-phosphate adenosyltransferase|nr:D-glycero-beta-D-manno-heptose 1-phosphate adenylyltransferase [Phycisphaerales bacterium]MBT7170254.1 D-glycero-beta-D-manno-heptose 1-phosphate adenylyltransferase [Phycisphaerales bacterium]